MLDQCIDTRRSAPCRVNEQLAASISVRLISGGEVILEFAHGVTVTGVIAVAAMPVVEARGQPRSASTASANAAIEVKVQSGVTLAGGAGVAPQRGFRGGG